MKTACVQLIPIAVALALILATTRAHVADIDTRIDKKTNNKQLTTK